MGDLPEAASVALRDDVIGELRRHGSQVSLARGEELVRDDGSDDLVHVITDGVLGVRGVTPLGEMGLMSLRRAGETIGELAALDPDGPPRAFSVTAVVAAEAIAVPGSRFNEMRREDADFSEWVDRMLARNLRQTARDMADALYKAADVRVTLRLLDARTIFGEVVPLAQHDLAAMAGTARPTVNRVLRRHEDAGLLSLGRGRITVLDADALREAAGVSTIDLGGAAGGPIELS